MKICRECNQEKSFSDFNKHPMGQHGLNPRCKDCRAIYNRSRYLIKGPVKEPWEKTIKYKYGLNKNDYEKILSAQKSLCAICGRKEKLVIDHCHKTGKFRGLLCSTCNQGLGKLGDSVQGLKKALKYLQKLPL